jgi:hypothetical protein
VSQLFEDPAYLQVPDKEKDLHLTYELIEKWRKFLDDYAERKNTDAKILVPQIWNSPIEDFIAYYQGDDKTQRAQVPMNFMLINELTASSTAADVKRVIDNYLKALPDGAVPNWFVSFHDKIKINLIIIYTPNPSSSALTIIIAWQHAWEKRGLTL